MQDSDLSKVLLHLLHESNILFLTISKLKKIPKKYQQVFGFRPDFTNSKLEQKIIPHLWSELEILKGSRNKFLAIKLPHNKIVNNYIVNHPGLTPRQVARYLPMLKDEFIKELNFLLDSGEIQIVYDNRYQTKLYPREKESVNPKSDRTNDYLLFREEFQNLDRGRIFVRICDLRKRLYWSREKFNSVLEELRDQGIIQLHTGDVSLMNDTEVKDSYIDENNFLHVTLTWRKNE